jgi:hypothetical protein
VVVEVAVDVTVAVTVTVTVTVIVTVIVIVIATTVVIVTVTVTVTVTVEVEVREIRNWLWTLDRGFEQFLRQILKLRVLRGIFKPSRLIYMEIWQQAGSLN